ncbi:hypothetical protein SODALDRAFT_344130 [Sodiomyces alkalinus F11]|uniref:Altered inheritance of mitochondria protein 32 n=1 Tax=Sodiomyces alkalinus (strain CBS 110278 / VKM F-3762 / F11) TaxID=1314773 RepID=A0A3N2PXB0_SODAK|nr:hypothetical protein SODALDRAFT_344130 [Sodiomyces alkalinus F11]ROT39122.1 hypothetical protein SODALDRAFT_344130 [Sodiomyces alkalinus F11]
MSSPFIVPRKTSYAGHVSAPRPSPGAPEVAVPLLPPPSFPTVPTCPPPTCACAATPQPPAGLEIDRSSPLNGVMSGYAEQVLVCTGRDDWPSRIEEEDGGENLAAGLKGLYGRGGMYSDPFHNTSVLNASFPSSPVPQRTATDQQTTTSTSVYLLPSFTYIPWVSRESTDSVRALVEGYLLPTKPHPAHDALPPAHRDRLTRKPASRKLLRGVRDVREVMVLICGHGGRDMRCGVAGPVLRAEFEASLPRLGVPVGKGPVVVEEEENAGKDAEEFATTESDGETVTVGEGVAARVGAISHIGGHKFAGNVIVYIPPGTKTRDGGDHPLAGRGIWYGRVEPKHVDGIIRETILEGKVIQDMFRGGIDQDRKILRI